MNIKKGIMVGFLAGTLLASSISFADSISKQIEVFYGTVQKIVIDGVDRTPTEQKPFVFEGTTYVPLRYVSEALGKPVDWDGKTGTAYIGSLPNEIVYLTDIKPYAFSNSMIEYSAKYDDNSMTMAGKSYIKGLQTKSFSIDSGQFFYNLDGKYSKIEGLVGLDDLENEAPVSLSFYLDDKEIKNITLKNGDLPHQINLDVTGGLQLKIKLKNDSVMSSSLIDFVDMKITKK